jgi:hypothetical protein
MGGSCKATGASLPSAILGCGRNRHHSIPATELPVSKLPCGWYVDDMQDSSALHRRLARACLICLYYTSALARGVWAKRLGTVRFSLECGKTLVKFNSECAVDASTRRPFLSPFQNTRSSTTEDVLRKRGYHQLSRWVNTLTRLHATGGS